MFSLFPKKSQTEKPKPLSGAATLSDSQLIQSVLSVFTNQKPVVGALFLVAWENISAHYPVFHKAMEEERLFTANFEGMSAFFALEHSKRMSPSESDEISSRRIFYFYIAALLKVAHQRAQKKPELWEQIVEVWVALLPSARSLRATLDQTQLWRKEYIEFFDMVRNEDEGENYVLNIIVPSNLRRHAKVIAWLERDLTSEQRRLIEETCNVFGSSTLTAASRGDA